MAARSVCRFPARGLSWGSPSDGERVFFVFPKPPPVPLHLVTLTALMDCTSMRREMEASVAAAYRDPGYVDEHVRHNPRAAHEARSRKLRLHRKAVDFVVPGYEVAWDLDPGNPMVSVFDKATRKVVGGVDGKNIYVVPDHRGRAIGAEVLILAFDLGIRHPDEMNANNVLSDAGRANRVAAHRMAVERALEAGKDVPDDVLEAYPDLMAPVARM